MDKRDLRRRIRAERSGRHPSDDFPARVLDAIPRGVVCVYVALPGEPPTEPVIEALLARGDTVFLPVAAHGGRLDWVLATDSRPWDAWGVPGHASRSDATVLPTVAAVVVPALAVDRHGRRLGQGGGYYDRFLPTQPQARTVALVWSGEVLDEVPAQPHDIGVDAWVIADD